MKSPQVHLTMRVAVGELNRVEVLADFGGAALTNRLTFYEDINHLDGADEDRYDIAKAICACTDRLMARVDATLRSRGLKAAALEIARAYAETECLSDTSYALRLIEILDFANEIGLHYFRVD